MFEAAEVKRLRSKLRGRVLAPEDREYDAARRVYNAMIDRKPRAIARCVAIADVVECVRLERRRER